VHRSMRRVGRGLAFESWLLAGETYLHVQSVRCFSRVQSCDERRCACASLLAGKQVSPQANGRCRRLRHDQPSRSGTWKLLVVVRSRAAAGVVWLLRLSPQCATRMLGCRWSCEETGRVSTFTVQLRSGLEREKQRSTKTRLFQDCAMRTCDLPKIA
jgi:hypothetical protein